MAKNHSDLRNALFESSEFLANVLARCAYIENQFCRNHDSETKTQMEYAIVRVYVSILCYTAEVQTVQLANIGRQMLESIIAITDQPLSKLKSSIDNEEQRLYQWVQIDQHLQRQQEAEGILARIDEVLLSVQDLPLTLIWISMRVYVFQELELIFLRKFQNGQNHQMGSAYIG